MVVQRLRRWANIKPALCQRVVFARYIHSVNPKVAAQYTRNVHTMLL